MNHAPPPDPPAWIATALPAGATVVEIASLASAGIEHRTLVLWMTHATRNPVDLLDGTYTCPDQTRGSYWRGTAFVSVVDESARRVLRTTALRGDDSADVDLPYRIRPGLYYRTHGAPDANGEAVAVVMHLVDATGDGRRLEFVLYDAVGCMPIMTSLVGYEPATDEVVQYQVQVTVDDGGRKSVETGEWWDYLFVKKPVAPGHWRYTIDYSGRGGSVDSYDLQYDAPRRMFVGTAAYASP